jgi:MFS family permease
MEQAKVPAAGMLAPLKDGTFRAMWLGTLVSNFGGLIQAVGAAWLMTSLTHSADMVALVQAATTLPVMLLSLVSGAVADSFDRRRVLIIAQAFMLAVSAALALCALWGMVTPWLLLGFTFLLGCGVALNNPSWQASVGDIVSRPMLPAAVALNSMAFNITRSVGPAIGGAIVAAAGAAGAFAVNAFTYLPFIVLLFLWRPARPAQLLPRERLFTAMGAGLRYVAMSPHLLTIYGRSFLFGSTSIAVLALLPIVAQTRVGGGPITYGVLLGAFGIGAVGGAFSTGRLRAVLGSEAIVRIAFLAFALCAAVCAMSDTILVTCLGLVAGGAAWVTALSLFNTTVQLSTPRWVVGRALSLYQAATFGGMALGSWLWGLLADTHGVATALGAAAGAMVVGAAVGLRKPLPRMMEIDLDPLNRFREPSVAIDIQPRSGPIAVLIEYRIVDADLTAFLETMSERERVRRRDGARHWTLTRDLEDPELWYEYYQTPTWTEYVRHNTRPTLADAAVGDTLRALHHGPERPRVHRMIVRPAVPRRTTPVVPAAPDIH